MCRQNESPENQQSSREFATVGSRLCLARHAHEKLVQCRHLAQVIPEESPQVRVPRTQKKRVESTSSFTGAGAAVAAQVAASSYDVKVAGSGV